MTSHRTHQHPKHATAASQSEAWRVFISATTDQDFYQSWLAVLSEKIAGIAVGVVLLKGEGEHAFLPAAIWPSVARDLSFLGGVAERSLIERRGVIQRPEQLKHVLHVAYPIEIPGRMLGAVVLEISERPEPEVSVLFRQIHWGMAWLHDRFTFKEIKLYQDKAENIGSVMEVMATALESGKLQQILFDVSNQIGHQLHCARVAIGIARDDVLRVQALSNTAWFEKNTNIMKLYVAAMEEAHDRMTSIAYQRPTETETTTHARSAHAKLAAESGAHIILSVPLKLGAECMGVITLERDLHQPFTPNEINWIDSLATLLPAVFEQKRRAERGFIALFRDDAHLLLSKLFGPKHLIWKFSAALLVMTLAVLLLVRMDYRVSAKTVIEGEVQRTAAVPFEGFLASAPVRAGDTVRQGQILATLDDKDLHLEQHKWESERTERTSQLREALAKRSLADVEILQAQVQQSEAQLALTTERIARSKITAPFDGIVISGDLSQQIGSPLELGKKLFEIAPLHSYRVILQVDEKEVSYIKTGQQGSLLLSGIAKDPIPLTISKITPIATAKDGRNYFRVEAQLTGTAPQTLRPGMEGVGKVNTGEQQLWWIMTHTFSDWVRVSLWNWMP